MSNHIPIADEFLAANRAFAVDFPDADLQVEPTRHVALVACMDSRMDLFQLLGLGHGEAHVIRNAGGVITDDVIRSLCLSQRFLKTREVVLVHHTDCGLERVTEDTFRSEMQEELGVTHRGWWRHSPIRTPVCASRCNDCTFRRSWPTRTTYGASSTA